MTDCPGDSASFEPTSDLGEGQPDEVGEEAVASKTPRQEIEELLEADESRLGDVYRWRVDGKTPHEMKDLAGVGTVGFVYNYQPVIDAALDGKPVNGPTLRRTVVSALNSLIKKARAHPISAEGIKLLIANRAAVEAAGAAEDDVTEAEAEEAERALAKKTLADLNGVPGIYAFSYGWYLEHPADEELETTFIKVGKALDIGARIKQHISGARAHMPEPLALVRAYSGESRDVDADERRFHRLLSAAGHENPRRVRREVGVEWFLTNVKFLDEIATAIGLTVEFEGQSEFADED